MNKAVLISIRPEWCALIASSKKRIELRKTRPKIDTPFKCYIYCTKSTDHPRGWLGCYDHDMHKFGLISPLNIEAGKHMNIEVVSGKVIGEFTCEDIYRVDVPFPAYQADMSETDALVLKDACLSYTEAHNYLGHRSGYGWKISDLVIYDEPKKLSEFSALCPRFYCQDTCPQWKHNHCDRLNNGVHPVTRPPQSWMFVEDMEE